jgi:hypothetical protein
VRSPLADILHKVPRELDQETLNISRSQAILRGVLERRGMNLGVGNRRDITRRMTARIGVLLESVKGGKTVTHPVLLTVRPAWSGLITNIRVFDLESNYLGAIPLRDPFAPMKETGVPRKLNLSLSCRRVTLKVRRGSYVNGQDSDDDEEQVLEGNRLVYRKKVPVYFEETVTELKFKFTDLLTGQYTCRRMKLTLNDMLPSTESAVVIPGGEAFRVNEFTPNEYGAESALASEDTSAAFDDRPATAASVLSDGRSAHHTSSIIRSMTISRMGSSRKLVRMNSVTKPVFDPAGKSLTRRLSVKDSGGLAAVTETNIESAEILRAGYSWKGRYYMVRIINDIDVTQVTLLQLKTNKVFVFLLTREHIDRTLNINRRLALLLEVLDANPLVKPLMETGKGLRADQAAACENPSMCMGKHCFVNLHPRSEGATIILLDPNSMPILGTGFEVMETDGVVLDSRPGSLRAASIRKEIVGSFKRQPSKRFAMSSSFSFRNNAIDEFLSGNLNPPPVAPEEDYFSPAPPLLGGRKHLQILPSIESKSTLLESAAPSRQASSDWSHESSFLAPLKEAETPTQRQVAEHPPISSVSSGSADDGDTFDMGPLRAIPVKAAAVVPVSTSAKLKKRPPAGRVPAARVKSLARRNMTEGATFEDALAAAAELQKNMAAFDIESRSSKSGKVSWAAWEAEKAEEARAIEAGELPPSLFVPSPPSEAAVDGAEEEGEEDEEDGAFGEEVDEESILKHIVDVPWIEELGSIEVVEYVTQDLLNVLLGATVKYIADQYVQLPIFQHFVASAVAAAVKKATRYLIEERELNAEDAVDEAEETVVEEIIDELIDDVVEERINKLNVMAYKVALAEKAQADAAEKGKTAKVKKPVVIHAHSAKPAPPAPSKSASALPIAPALTIVVPEPEPEPEAPRQAAVPFSQPYRAAPDSPVAAVPVKYNVQKIISRPETVVKHSSRPYSKRDNLVPVLGAQSAVNKKRHNPEYMLAAQTYQPPQQLGRTSPQSSIYTGTFSRSDVFPGGEGQDALGFDEVGPSVKVYHPDSPNSRAHLLHFNTIDPLPVLDPRLPAGTVEELAQPVDPVSPSKRVQGLRSALEDWDTRDGGHSPLLTVGRIADSTQQPYKTGALSPKHQRHSHLSVATDDDGAVSISSENTDGSNPLFRTIQRRKLSLPMEEDSVYSVGSASRAGARRSPNKRTMLDFAVHGGSSVNGDSWSLGDDSSVYSLASLRSSNGMVSMQPRADPLQVKPHKAKALEKRLIVQQSLDDKRYLGYVKDRPLAHSSHWRGKLFAYLTSLRNADHLRKHVAMLAKASRAQLTPEEAVCALADAQGSVGEVTDKLKSLEFQSEIKLVCRSLHVRSMVCMLEGGERLFKDTDVDTFGDHGEFDDLSMYSDQLIRKKSNLVGAEVSHSLQHTRSVQAKPYKQRTNSNFSRTAPHLLPLASSSSLLTRSSTQQLTDTHSRSSFTAPVELTRQPTTASSFHTASDDTMETGDPVPGDDPMDFGELPDVIVEGESESERNDRLQPPSLAAMFHLGREDSMLAVIADDGDDNSSVTMSLGSVDTRSWYQPKAIPYQPQAAPTPTSTGHYPFSRAGTSNSVVSAASAASSQNSSTAPTPSLLADQATSMQLTPGIRSILTMPRQKTSKDIVAQSPTIARRATFVPLKFGSNDSPNRSRKAAAQAEDGAEGYEDGDGLSALSGGGSGTSSPVRDMQRAASMNLFNKWGSSALLNARGGAVTSDAAGELSNSNGGSKESTARDPPRHTLMHMSSQLSVDSEANYPGGSISPVKPLLTHMLSKKASMARLSSFRLGGRIDDLLVEHGDTPVAVMCRRDLLKAQQDEVLLKSDKHYIRAPIEKKIGIVRTALSFMKGGASAAIPENTETV